MQYDDISGLIGETASSFDPFAGVRELLPALMIGSIVITLVFVLFFVFSTISRIRSERAMVAMQKDISQIRQLLEQQTAKPAGPAKPMPRLAANDPLPPRWPELENSNQPPQEV